MKIMIVLLVTLLSVSLLFGSFSKVDAINLVLNDILKDEVNLIDVYVKADSMCSADTLRLLNEEPISPPFSVNWVFFVDDLPGTHWHHSCRYIFISTIDGASQVFSKSICPFGDYSDFELVSQWQRPDPQYDPPDPPTPPTPNPVDYPPNPHLWAVMISGVPLGCDYEFWNSASQFYTMLTGWGYTEDHIKVNYNVGTGPDSQHSLNSNNPLDNDIDTTAHRDSIEATFSYLESILTPDDILVVYISGHGNNDDSLDTYFAIPEGVVYDYDLADMVDDINCSSMFFLINFCHSGGFVDNLADTSTSSCLNRTIHTACNADEESAGDWWITLHNHDSVSLFEEFPMYWSAAAQGMYPLYNDMGDLLRYFDPVPYQHLVRAFNTGSFPFECYSYDAWNNTTDLNPADDESIHEDYPDKNPDALGNVNEPWGNNDGILQLTEIFNYANYYDTRSTFGYLNPYSSQNVGTYLRNTTTPQRLCTQPDLDDYMTLRGIAGSVSDPDLHITTNSVIGDNLTLLPGTELFIESGVSINILNGSSIIVEEGATLNIASGVTIFCQGEVPAIIVHGSINIAYSVQFSGDNLSSGLALKLENSQPISISEAWFIRCSIISEYSSLSVVNSTFVNGSIRQHSNSLSVSGCNFINSNISAYQTGIHLLTDQVTVYETIFNGFNGSAIKITGYPKYALECNTLSNVGGSFESAIVISESGSGGLYSIIDNSISDCANAGIKLYHSFAKITSVNHISNCVNGIVAMRESSWAAEGNQSSPYQVLSENETYELFLSYDSVPENFTTMIIDHGTYNTPYVMCINVPPSPNRIDLSYNSWDRDFVPINDLQPSGLYGYLLYWCQGTRVQSKTVYAKSFLTMLSIT